MKSVFLAFLTCTIFITCSTNNSKDLSGRYTINDMYNLIESEKTYLLENRLDNVYSIDSFFIHLSNYRSKLISILKEEELPIIFDRGFLIEDFFVYKKGIRKSIKENYPFDYRAVVFMESSDYKQFLDTYISKDCKTFKVDKIRLNKRKTKAIQSWLSEKTELKRQDLKNGYVNEWEDQYDVISKLIYKEKFCRVLINYFWNITYNFLCINNSI